MRILSIIAIFAEIFFAIYFWVQGNHEATFAWATAAVWTANYVLADRKASKEITSV